MDPLATPEQLETYAGLGLLGEPRGDMLLDAASAAVRGYCGWHIAPSLTETLTLDGSGGQVQTLPTLHLTDVTEVLQNGTAVDLATVQWSAAGYLWRPCAWSTPGCIGAPLLRGVTVAIVHGYTPVPAELVAVVCSVAARAAVSPTGVVREQTGPFSVTYSQTAPNTAGGVALLPAETAILDRYRIPGRA